MTANRNFVHFKRMSKIKYMTKIKSKKKDHLNASESMFFFQHIPILRISRYVTAVEIFYCTKNTLRFISIS